VEWVKEDSGNENVLICLQPTPFDAAQDRITSLDVLWLGKL
jgi:hypothetical protein